MSDTRKDNNGVSSATVLALVEALYAYADNPAHWHDITAAIEALPSPLDPARDPEAAAIMGHATRAAVIIDRLNAGRREQSAGVEEWDAVLLSSEGVVRGIVGRGQERLEAFLSKPLAVGKLLSLPAPSAHVFDSVFKSVRLAHEISLVPFTLASTDERARCFGVLVPRAGFPLSLAAAFGLGEVFTEPLLAVVLLSARDARVVGQLTYRNFGLTGSETRLVARLLQGLTISETAAALGMTTSTARWHLKNIFTKTGTRRQADLLRLLTNAAEFPAKALSPDGVIVPWAPPRRLVTLDDGRRLCFREYGVPSGAPVIYFHFGLSASMMPPAAAKAALKSHARVIAFERPGFGQSDPRAEYTFEGIATDVEELARHLNLKQVSLFGDGYGGGFAVATACKMGAAVKRLALHAPNLGRRSSNAGAGVGLSVLYRQPWIIPGAAEMLRRGLRIPVIRSLLGYITERSQPDAVRMEDPEFLSYLNATIFDALERTSAGLASELVMFGQAIRADPRALTCSVGVWHGVENPVVPLSDTRVDFEAHPHASLRVLQDTGLYLNESVFEEIFCWLASDPRTAVGDHAQHPSVEGECAR